MWNPFKKKQEFKESGTYQTHFPTHFPPKIHLRILVVLSEHDFQYNLARVKKLADQLEPVVHLLRTQQRALARLELLSLNKKPMYMDEEAGAPVDGGSAAPAAPADGTTPGEAPAAE